MTKQEIQVGKVYMAKVSNKLTKVKVVSVTQMQPQYSRDYTSYECTNLSTGRIVYFRSAAKFRKQVEA